MKMDDLIENLAKAKNKTLEATEKSEKDIIKRHLNALNQLLNDDLNIMKANIQARQKMLFKPVMLGVVIGLLSSILIGLGAWAYLLKNEKQELKQAETTVREMLELKKSNPKVWKSVLVREEDGKTFLLIQSKKSDVLSDFQYQGKKYNLIEIME